MSRSKWLGAVLVLCLAACSKSPATDALAEAASKLDEVKSGDLTLRLSATSQGVSEATVGFALQGRFALPRPGGLPVAEMTYTRIQGTEQTQARFISTGSKAFVELDGTLYQLGPAQTAALGAPASASGGNPLAKLGLDDWVVNPRLSNGGAIQGDAVDRVSGRLAVANAVNDLLELAKALGSQAAALPQITGQAATRLERAVRSSTFEALIDRASHHLRRVVMTVDFTAAAPPSLRPALQTLAGVKVTFELDLNRVNQPVQVAEPQGAVPYPQKGGS